MPSKQTLQEGWLSPTERASVSAISLRYIIWLPHESHADMSLPTADLRVHLATSRDPKAHFGLLWVRPLDYRGKCYMDRKRIQCLAACTHLSSTISEIYVVASD